MPKRTQIRAGNPRLLVVVNLHASRAATSIGSALARFASHGFDLDVRLSSSGRDSLAQLVRECIAGVDAVVIAGGDGTLNGTIPALLEARKPVGILPFGTANDLALTLGIPSDPVGAADVIAEGMTRDIDVGRVNDAWFVNVASIGLSVQIAQRQDENLKKHWGIFSYAVAAVGTLTEAHRFEATVSCAGRKERVHAYQIAVGNGIHYGGGLTVSPRARIDDGVLDVYAIETVSLAELIALAPGLRDGTLVERIDVAFFRGPTALIETREPMPVNTDGEVTTETPAEFSIVRRAIKVYAPPEQLDQYGQRSTSRRRNRRPVSAFGRALLTKAGPR